jgi:hypothetical protein
MSTTVPASKEKRRDLSEKEIQMFQMLGMISIEVDLIRKQNPHLSIDESVTMARKIPAIKAVATNLSMKTPASH